MASSDEQLCRQPAGAAGEARAMQVLGLVKAAATRHRPLQLHVRQLTLDLLVVLVAARPAVLLDYTPGLQAGPLLDLVHTINCVADTNICCVLSLDGCHTVANTAALHQHLGQLLGEHTRPCLVGFAPTHPDGPAEEGLVQPVLLGRTAAKATILRLAGLHGRLAAALACSSQSAGSAPPLHLTLDGDPSLPLMPTLYGLLLGYPVVYVVEGKQRAAAQASRCLSCTNLTRFTLTALPPRCVAEATPALVAHAIHKKKKKGMACTQPHDSPNTHLISAFTVPAHLLQAVVLETGDIGLDQALEGWNDNLEPFERHGNSSLPGQQSHRSDVASELAQPQGNTVLVVPEEAKAPSEGLDAELGDGSDVALAADAGAAGDRGVLDVVQAWALVAGSALQRASMGWGQVDLQLTGVELGCAVSL